MYELLIVIHILAAIAWVGGGLTGLLAVNRARAEGGAMAADEMSTRLEWMEKFIFIPAPILVLLTGITMVIVSDAWSFGQAWVYLALGLIVVSGALGGGVGGSLEKQMSSMREEGSVETPAYSSLLDRVSRWGWIEMALLVAIVVLMVYKPGI